MHGNRLRDKLLGLVKRFVVNARSVHSSTSTRMHKKPMPLLTNISSQRMWEHFALIGTTFLTPHVA